MPHVGRPERQSTLSIWRQPFPVDGSTGRRAPSVGAAGRTRRGEGSAAVPGGGCSGVRQLHFRRRLSRCSGGRAAGVQGSMSAARARPLTLACGNRPSHGHDWTASWHWEVSSSTPLRDRPLLEYQRGPRGQGPLSGGVEPGAWSLGAASSSRHPTPVTTTSQLDIGWTKLRNGDLRALALR